MAEYRTTRSPQVSVVTTPLYASVEPQTRALTRCKRAAHLMLKYLAALVTLLAMLMTGPAQAVPIAIDITGLTPASPFVVSLDLISGNDSSNDVRVTSVLTNGALGALQTSGDVTGALAGPTLRIADGEFFNSAQFSVTGASTLRLAFDLSETTPLSGFLDSFALFLLDPVLGTPLFQTSDPTGSNSLFAAFFSTPGPGQDGWDTYVATDSGVSWTVREGTTPDPVEVPEPLTWPLLLIGLVCMSLRRAKRTDFRLRDLKASIALLTLFVSAPLIAAEAEDVTGSVTMQRSGFLLNRTSNTFDTVVTIRNTSAVPISGPFSLVLDSVSPANAVLFNVNGETEAGKPMVSFSVPTGALAPGATYSQPVKFRSAAGISNAAFRFRAVPLPDSSSATLQIAAYLANDAGESSGQSAGPGLEVVVDGVTRGVTDAAGRLSIRVPVAAQEVAVRSAPNTFGSVVLEEGLQVGEQRAVEVVVGNGGEIYADGAVRFDQITGGLLQRGLSALSLRFHNNEIPIRIARVDFANIVNVLDQSTSMDDLLSIAADGSVAINAAGFYQRLAAATGRLSLQVSAADAQGRTYFGSVAFSLSQFRVRLQLVAPPSRADLPLAGTTVQVSVLNTPVKITVVTDQEGSVLLPNLPAGNVELLGTTLFNGLIYTGAGTAAITTDITIRLVVRAPADLLNNVNPISTGPFTASPSGVAALQSSTVKTATTGEPAAVEIFTRAQMLERARRAAQLKGGAPTQKSAPVAASATGDVTASAVVGAGTVQVTATAALQNATISDSGELDVPQGTQEIVLTYSVFTYEYPTYVLANSIYNDVWTLKVLTSGGALLFNITKQINSQLAESPMWQSNGSTGDITVPINVASLTATSSVTLVLNATSQNIGDSLLATIVTAQLDANPQLTISDITPDAINANNGGTYYSVPGTGLRNTLQRILNVTVTKPSGSDIARARVDLLSAAGGVLGTSLNDVAVGSDGVELVSETATQAKLKVRATFKAPLSSIPGVPPPTRDLGFRLNVIALDEQGAELSGTKDFTGRRSLWKMPDGFARYGTRDSGQDYWVSRGGYTWMNANRALLREIDDVSGEHGRNIGHTTHAHGSDIDMYHFYRFPGATSGASNHSLLQADLVAAFATVNPPGTPPASAVVARGRVAAWVGSSRAGVAALAQNASVAQVIYCRGGAAQGMPAGWCNSLLRTGSVTRTEVIGGVSQSKIIEFGAWGAIPAKLNNNDVHNSHVHVTLNRTAIGE